MHVDCYAFLLSILKFQKQFAVRVTGNLVGLSLLEEYQGMMQQLLKVTTNKLAMWQSISLIMLN